MKIFLKLNLAGEDLREMDLRGMNLQEVYLFGANLQGAKVTKSQAEILRAQGLSGFVVRDVIKQEDLLLESQPKERRF